jgi:hypothetical protein
MWEWHFSTRQHGVAEEHDEDCQVSFFIIGGIRFLLWTRRPRTTRVDKRAGSKTFLWDVARRKNLSDIPVPTRGDISEAVLN